VVNISEEPTIEMKFCIGCGTKWEKSPCKVCGMSVKESIPPAIQMDETLFRAIAELNMKLDVILVYQKRSNGFGHQIGTFIFSLIDRIFSRKPSPNTLVPQISNEIKKLISDQKVIVQPIVIPFDNREPSPAKWPYQWVGQTISPNWYESHKTTLGSSHTNSYQISTTDNTGKMGKMLSFSR
jgi:hypothetical protein